MFTPLLDKTAEPPPPKGVSVSAWDRILGKGPSKTVDEVEHEMAVADGEFKGSFEDYKREHMTKKTAAPIELIRHLSALEMEKRAFEELTSPMPTSSIDALALHKMDSIADPELFSAIGKIAQVNEQGVCDGLELLETYEALGGTYKHAFGQQMFDVKQMAGSPAVSGGMNSRAKTPMPQTQQTPVSVTTTSIGQTNGQGGTASPTSQTSTPSAPTG